MQGKNQKPTRLFHMPTSHSEASESDCLAPARWPDSIIWIVFFIPPLYVAYSRRGGSAHYPHIERSRLGSIWLRSAVAGHICIGVVAEKVLMVCRKRGSLLGEASRACWCVWGHEGKELIDTYQRQSSKMTCVVQDPHSRSIPIRLGAHACNGIHRNCWQWVVLFSKFA